MKLVKLFGIVVGVHVALFMFIFAIPGCRSTAKKPAATATSPDLGGSPISGSSVDAGSPVSAAEPAPAVGSELSSVRFSPTRPGTAAATAETIAPTPPEAAPAGSYTIVKGDSLWSIAKKHNITVKELTSANNIRSDAKLNLGQKLVIPGKTAPKATSTAGAPSTVSAAKASAVTTTATTSTAVTHVIKSGETLGTIAKKYQVKVGDIATANNIADPTKLRVGQTLKIPGYQAAGKASTAPKSSTTSSTRTDKTAPSTPAAPTPTPTPTPVSPIFSDPSVTPAPSSPVESASPISSAAPDAPVMTVQEAAPRL